MCNIVINCQPDYSPPVVTGTIRQWEGYSAVPYPHPVPAPILEPTRVPAPAAQAIPQLIPHLIQHPNLVPHKTPQKTQREPALVPGRVPEMQEVVEPPMLGNNEIPDYDPFNGTSTPGYLESHSAIELTDLLNNAEIRATQKGKQKFAEEWAKHTAKIEQEQDADKREKLREEQYGEAMAAFYASKTEEYIRVTNEAYNRYLQEQAQAEQERKNQLKEIKAKKHELAKAKLEAQIAKEKAKATNPPG